MYNKKDKDKMWIIYLKLVGLKLKKKNTTL
jgi:hypothetical protein